MGRPSFLDQVLGRTEDLKANELRQAGEGKPCLKGKACVANTCRVRWGNISLSRLRPGNGSLPKTQVPLSQTVSWPGTDGTALNFDSGQEGTAGEGELFVPPNEETVKIEIEDGLFFTILGRVLQKNRTISGERE